MRKALQPWSAAHPAAGGRHKGIPTANMPWEIYVACSNGESIDATVYRDLHSVIDLDGLLDILELREVHRSWANAEYLNAQDERERRGR